VVGTDGRRPAPAHDRRMTFHTITLAETHRHELLADSARSRSTRRRRGPSLRIRRRHAPDPG